MDKKVLGQEYKRGLAEGFKHGRYLIARQIEKRFGPTPIWVKDKMLTLTQPELEEVALRVIDAPTLEKLFPQ